MSTSQKVVLAVDDAPENLDVIKAILGPHYKIKAAVNGPMALKIVGKAPPDLILLDLIMPGMDGYEVCRRLKADSSTKHVPIIVISGEEVPAQPVEELGACAYLRKPVDAERLLSLAREHTEGRS